MAKKNKGCSVCWYTPNNKKPIAYSDAFALRHIKVLSSFYLTVNHVYNACYGNDMSKKILKLYISKGYGNHIAKDVLLWKEM